VFNHVFPYVLVGLVAWNLARAARHRQISNLLTAGAALLALLGHFSRNSVLFLGALLLLGLGVYLQGRERSQRAMLASQRQDEPGDDAGAEPARLPGETTEDMIERHVLGIRTAPNAAPMRARARAAHRALQGLRLEELRPVFELVEDPNAAVRALALPLLIDKGDEAALELLRGARSQHRDLETGYVLAVCHRGSPALEPALTHAEREPRREALLLLVRTVIGRVYPALGSDRPEVARLVKALLAESDTELLLELSSKLAEHSHLHLIRESWSQFSLPSRRALLRLSQLGPERAQLEELVTLFEQALQDAEPQLMRAAVQALRQPGAEALRAKLGDPALPLRGWTELTIVTGATSGATLPCKAGGVLRVAPGPLRARIRFRQLGGPELSYVRVLLELPDSEGRCWQLRSYVRGEAFTAALQAEALRPQLPASEGFTSWSQAPVAWQEALHERCLLARLAESWDSHAQVELRLGERKHALALHHQRPSIDVGLLGDQLVVRVSGLRESKFKGRRPWRVFAGSAPLPPLVWLSPAQLLLCFSEPRRHYPRARDLDDRADPAQCRPCRARLLERRSEPQPVVVFASDQLTPAAVATSAAPSSPGHRRG
jgi:hypothetical protein